MNHPASPSRIARLLVTTWVAAYPSLAHAEGSPVSDLAPTPSVAAPPPRAFAPSPPVDTVFVHLESFATTLQARASSSAAGPWLPVCTAPCDGFVPRQLEYRVYRGTSYVSHPFRLRGGEGQGLTLTPTFHRDPTFTVVGIVFAGGGLVTLLGDGIAAFGNAICGNDGPPCAHNGTTLGWIAAGSVLAMLAGTIMILSNETGSSSDLSVLQTRAPVPALPVPVSPTSASTERVPVWIQPVGPQPQAVAVPLLSGAF